MKPWQEMFQRVRKRIKGQTMVEFALALPLLLLLIFGIIEFGLIFAAWLTIENAARQAARYAASGQYNVAYCAEIASLFDSLPVGNPARPPASHTYAGWDAADGRIDCQVPSEAEGVTTDDPTDFWYYQNITARLQDAARLYSIPVSYTHLTLPTIYSV